MKKHFKKIIAVALIIVMVFSIAGCGATTPPQAYSNQEECPPYYDAIADSAQSVGSGNIVTTNNGNQIKFEKLKIKRSIRASHSYIYFLTWIAYITGGVVITPGSIKADKGSKVVDVKLTYTNKSDSEQMLSDVLQNSEIMVNGVYYYPRYAVEKMWGMKFDDSSLDRIVIKKGKKKTIHVLTVATEADIESGSDISFALTLDGTNYVYK